MPCVAELVLLDTCVLQHLAWVERKLAEEGDGPVWTDIAIARLRARFGEEMSEELLVLGHLWLELQDGAGYIWLISAGSQSEISKLAGSKGEHVRDLFRYFANHQEDMDWAASSVAPGALDLQTRRPSPLILRGLGVSHVDEITADAGPLGFLPDFGDRKLVREALLANVPLILTLDLRSFWRHRTQLADLGVEVLRPTDLDERYRSSRAHELSERG